MKILDLINQIETDFPLVSSMDFDNSGANVVDSTDELNGVLVTLDITIDAIEFAKVNSLNLIISHHPMIFNKIRNINDDPVSKRIKLLNKYGINAYSCHTNYDVNLNDGMGINLLKCLFDNNDIDKFEILEKFKVDNCEYGIGNIVYLKKDVTFNNIKDLFIDKLNLDIDKIACYPLEKRIKKMIIIPGSGSGEIDIVIKEKPDLLITSDLKHNQIIDLIESGISYIDATHYGLENIFIKSFKNYLENLKVLSNINVLNFDINL